MRKNKLEKEENSLMQQFAVKVKRKITKDGNRALIFNRCSTEKQDSLSWQEKVCKNLCEQREWIVEKCFGEKESATDDNREVFQEMINYAIKEKINHIVIYSYNRFSRTGDLSLLQKLRSKGIKVHAASQSVDDQTPSGRFSQKLYLMFAEMENEQRRDSIVEGLREKLERGEWPGKPTIGYDKRYVTGKKEHDHDKRQCFVNETGELIRQAFLWKDEENISNVEIQSRLQSMGLKLTLTKLNFIFKNPFYCGYITNNILESGKMIKGKHEPLISEEVFLRVNGIIKNKTHGWNVIREHKEMPLKASIRCCKCNRLLTAYPQKGKYIYYKCPNIGCRLNIRNEKLHKLFEQELLRYSFDPSLIPILKTELERTYRTIYELDTNRAKPMKDELTRLRNELETMEFNLAVGKISSEIYEKHSASHYRKIKQIEEDLKILVEDSSNLSNYIETSLKNVSNLLNLWHLHDYSGKVRLQKLIFPDGLQYDHENRTVRTPKVNPIVSLITTISNDLAIQSEIIETQNATKYRQVYSSFTSSNFFWESLEHLVLESNYLTQPYSTEIPHFPTSSMTISGNTLNPIYSSTTTSLNPITNMTLESNKSQVFVSSYSGDTMHAS
jgi:DNA invertase Pin-like site-specific DNA recombinase